MRRISFAVAGYVATALLSLAGCGAEAVTPSSTIDESGNGNVGQPPGPGPEKAPDGEGVVLAVSQLFLGDTDREGNPDPEAWMEYGYNIDGKVSTPASADLCNPVEGATPAQVYQDGVRGIDNSFGKNILPALSAILSNASTQASDAIANGDFTVMLSIEKLGEDASYYPLVTKLYGGASLGEPPAWDGTDQWPVLPDLLEDPTDISSSKVLFTDSYLVDNTWVSGKKREVQLNLVLAGNTIKLTVRNAVLTMDLNPDHKGAINGMIAGVLETEAIIAEIAKVVGFLDQNLCEGAIRENIIKRIRSASDILSDGTQDSSKECDAISIGLGFSMKQVQLGDVAERTEGDGTDPCAAPQEGG